MRCDPKIIENNLIFFGHLEAGGCTEVRIFPTSRYLTFNGRREYVGTTVSGYYNDYAKLASDVIPFDGKAAIYFTLNPCKPELMYRATNRLELSATQTTSDNDILCDMWFPIDLDPVCPTMGISSSDAELALTIQKRGEILSYLHVNHDIQCIGADSGNGCHLLIKTIVYPNNEKTKQKKKTLMQYLSQKFSNAQVNIDSSVSNMARIWKLYGTHACKGDPSEERPHRLSKLYLPEEAIPPTDLYSHLKIPSPASPSPTPKHKSSSPVAAVSSYANFNVEAYLNHWGKEWRILEKGNITWYQFKECPVHSDHDGHEWECGICQDTVGKMGAKCMHNEDYSWVNFKTVLGDIQPYLDKPPHQLVGDSNASPLPNVHPGGAELLPTTHRFPEFPPSAWRGIFNDFREAHYKTTEAPQAFLFGAMSAVVGALMGRQCWIRYGVQTYPNMYLALIGETAKSHKSTAASKAESLLKLVDPSALCYQNLATAEGFIDILVPLHEDDEETEHERHNAGISTDELSPKFNAQLTRIREKTLEYEGFRLLAYIDEFSSLLKKATRESSSGLIEAITLAYNCPTKLDNPTRVSPLRAPNPTVSILTTTTVGRLMKNLLKEDTEGGFANRFTYFYGTSTEEIDWPEPEDTSKLNAVVVKLKQARLRWQNTEFFLLDSARALWKQFYHKWKVTRDGDTIDSVTSRLPTNAVKLAMQFALLENDTPEIKAEQLQAAIDIANYWYEVIKILFGGYGKTETQIFEQQVLDALSNGGKSRNELYDVFSRNIDAKQLNSALDNLSKMEKITQFREKTRGRPRVMYKKV